ncbi:ABC transporter permease [soil metagenome]
MSANVPSPTSGSSASPDGSRPPSPRVIGRRTRRSRGPLFPAYSTAGDKLAWWAVRIVCVLVLLFLLAPILVIIPLSFSDSSFLVYPITGWSTKWYHQLFESAEWARATKNSFIVAPSATVLATVLGTLAAVGLTRTDFPFKGLLMSVLIAPMVVPIVVVGVATYLFFAPIGLADSYTGLIIVHAALGAPFVLTTVMATLAGFNQNLVRASLSCGETPLNSFFRITLPVIAPGVISGALFAFATSFDEVVVTLFLAGAKQVTLPRQMFNGIRENISPTIAAVATLLIIFTTSLLLVLEWLRGRRR